MIAPISNMSARNQLEKKYIRILDSFEQFNLSAYSRDTRVTYKFMGDRKNVGYDPIIWIRQGDTASK